MDHKPLVPILGQKSLDSLPPRVLHFCLRLMRFQYSIYHSPGKALHLADTLSHAPLPDLSEEVYSPDSAQEVEDFVKAVISSHPADQDRLEVYR